MPTLLVYSKVGGKGVSQYGVLPKLGARACKLDYLTPGECSPVEPNAAPRKQNVTHVGQNAAPVGQREFPAPKEIVPRQHRSPGQAPGPSNRQGEPVKDSTANTWQIP